MNPTRTLETADFSLHRVIFSSRQRLSRTFSKSTDFRCQIDLPRNQDVFRFAIRRVTFPNVANPWDLTDAPYLYFRVQNTTANWSGVYRVRLTYRWTEKIHVAASVANDFVEDGQLLDLMRTKAERVTVETGSAPAGSDTDFTTLMAKLDIYFSGNQLTFAVENPSDLILTVLGMEESAAGGDQPPSHYANNILGISQTIGPLNSNQTQTAKFPVNLTGLLHVYLTSTILTATARSMRPVFAPVENCLTVIPVASTYLTLVDHRPEAPTVWNCNQDNHWDVVDFQLRYDTGNVVDLGGNDIEIEIEFEVMEQFNPPMRQMKEAIYVPFVNTFDTTKLLLKRDNRSWGSYGGNTGSRQFSSSGYAGRVFR